MPDCLSNLIGIDKKCSPDVPSSGYFIQDLPGVTIKVADSATDEETPSGIDLINDKIDFAKKEIWEEVRNFLRPKMKMNSVIENDTIGYYGDNLETVSLDNGYLHGVRVRIDNYPYLEFYVNSIYLQLSTSGAKSIYVYNLSTGKLLDTISVTTVADVPTEVSVQKTYKTNKQKLNLFFAIDGNVTTYKSYLSKGQNPAQCATCTGGYRNNWASFDNIKIASGSTLIDSSARANTYTSGLSINYSLSCSVEPFICNMSNMFAWALLHKTGAELMRELQYSKRLNSYVIIDKGANEKLREEFDATYKRSMTTIFDNLALPDDGLCFKCTPRVKTTVRIP
jgi:hypothetical protein